MEILLSFCVGVCSCAVTFIHYFCQTTAIVILPFSPREICISVIANLKGTSRPWGSLETNPHTYTVRSLFAFLLVCVDQCFQSPYWLSHRTHWWVEIDKLQYCFRRVLQHSSCAGLLHSCPVSLIKKYHIFYHIISHLYLLTWGVLWICNFCFPEQSISFHSDI